MLLLKPLSNFEQTIARLVDVRSSDLGLDFKVEWEEDSQIYTTWERDISLPKALIQEYWFGKEDN